MYGDQLDRLPGARGLFSDSFWEFSSGSEVQVPGGFIDLLVFDQDERRGSG